MIKVLLGKIYSVIPLLMFDFFEHLERLSAALVKLLPGFRRFSSKARVFWLDRLSPLITLLGAFRRRLFLAPLVLVDFFEI